MSPSSSSESDSEASVYSSRSSASSSPSHTNLKSVAKRNTPSSEEQTSKNANNGLAGSKKRKRDIDETKVPENNERVENYEQEEVKVLSHKEQRRLRKKQKTLAATSTEPITDSKTMKSQVKEKPKAKEKGDEQQQSKRQNSVWVGNLSYRTTPDALRAFFVDAGAGEVTRVHMPYKGAPGVEKMKGLKTVKENRGFAYVDFGTPDAKALAISLSEKNLDGRRLLIKDGDDFSGRPTISSSPTAEPGLEDTFQRQETDTANPSVPSSDSATKQSGFSLGPTKTAKKILKAQKQPPCPCLFLGNLGYEATEEKIRQMFEGHARATALMKAKKKREKEKKKSVKISKGKNNDLLGIEDGERDEAEEDIDAEIDVGIKKVRLGTFEDSGVCKGFAFVDFTSTQHATAALTNLANHFLDGRALVVEYASPEAARRGGYRPGAEKAVQKKEREMKMKRAGKDKYNDWKKKLKPVRGSDADAKQPRAEVVEAREEGEPGAKRPRTDADGTNTTKMKAAQPLKEKRQKPGAALASAQREKYAIVPSEGTRLKFS
ncbi:RNA-binding domain-containing protein [Sanghuangporus baumii]|uniref:RNA-binding domain-containing protein n=1 Tax=Sanghuangporus baumii TaxID=108892 RepID=A0A9Q5MYJ3_SANBA|nr:RNA-binding domain-containing protein [Sanghuangporus baumii]